MCPQAERTGGAGCKVRKIQGKLRVSFKREKYVKRIFMGEFNLGVLHLRQWRIRNGFCIERTWA